VARRRKTWRFRLNDATTLEVSAAEGLTEKQVRRRGRFSLILGTLVAAAMVVTVAYADNLITQDLVTDGNATATRLGGGNAEVYVAQTGGACDANGDRINVTSNQSWLTIASPGYVNVTGCGPGNAQSIAYSVTSAAPLGGVATLTGSEHVNDTQINTGPNSDFDVTVVPRAPSSLGSPSKTASSIDLSWTASPDATDITDYELQRSTDGGSSWSSLTNPAKTDTTYTDSVLDPGTEYCYQLRASFQSGGVGNLFSAFAASLCVTTDLATPADTTAPDIQYTLNPASADGANGWYKSNVTLTWTVTENESQSSLVKTGCDDQNITADQQETTYSCSATSDGGSAGPVSVTIKRDATIPTVSVTGFTDGQVFVKGVDTLPTAGCSRSDATSGIDASGSTGPTVTAGGLTVNGVGSVTYTCYAKDNAGNLANASATYQVNYGGLSGILQPINPENSSVFSRGKAVPVKFQLGGDEYTGFNFSGWTLKQQQTACTIDGDPVGGELEPVVENPSNSFRYDAAADQYIYNANFKSMAVGTCWKVVVTLDSGQKLNSAVFKLQK
jgi:hypothetical protein